MKFTNGVLEDARTPAEIQKNYLDKELVFESPLVWEDFEVWKKKPENIKLLAEIQNMDQGGSGSCLAQAGTLALAINNYKKEGRFIPMSARPIYLRRSNRPMAGMWMDDLGKILTEWGTVFESLFASQKMGEEEMNKEDGYLRSFDALGKIYSAEKYIWVHNKIDSVAQILNLQFPVVLGFRFGDGEWNRVDPIIKSEPKYGHGVCAIPRGFFTYKGKKAILIQDSWGVNTGWNGRRIITEDWFNDARMLGAIVPLEGGNNSTQVNYQFKKDLCVGMQDYDVEMLQRTLNRINDKDGRLFTTFDFTGYFGGMTLKAVKRFQALKGINQTGYVGKLTREALNNL